MRSGFGQNSCAANEQACVFDSCASKKKLFLKIFMINPKRIGLFESVSGEGAGVFHQPSQNLIQTTWTNQIWKADTFY